METVEVLKALGDETRMRMMNLIQGDSLCVCEIQEVLDISQSNTSRHLIKLKNAGLVEGKKKAQWVYYGVKEGAHEKYPFLKRLLEDAGKEETMQKDIEKLKNLIEKGISCKELTEPKS